MKKSDIEQLKKFRAAEKDQIDSRKALHDFDEENQRLEKENKLLESRLKKAEKALGE